MPQNAPFLALALLGVIALWAKGAQAATGPLILTPEDLQAITDPGTGEIALPETWRGDYTAPAEATAVQQAPTPLTFIAWGLQAVPDAVAEAFTMADDPMAVTDPDWAPGDGPNSSTPAAIWPVETLVDAVAEYLKGPEGLRLYVYDDATGRPWLQSQRGNPTIGYGHLLKKTDPLDWVLPDEPAAYALLLQDVRDHLLPIIPRVHVPLSVVQWIDIASLAFNAGVGAVLASDWLLMLNAGDLDGAAVSLASWRVTSRIVVNGVETHPVNSTLVARRANEAAMLGDDSPVIALV